MSLNAFYVVVLAVGFLVGLGVTFFVQYKKLDQLESYFSENEMVQRNKRFWGRNKRVDRIFRSIVIIEFFTLPKMNVKRGDVTEQELASVPLALRRWATWPYYFALIWFAATFIWVAWRKW